MLNKALDKKVLLSTMWIFVTINYIYCDVFTLFYSEDLKKFLAGKVGENIAIYIINGDKYPHSRK